jgi:hypothetical protein
MFVRQLVHRCIVAFHFTIEAYEEKQEATMDSGRCDCASSTP